VVYVQGQLIADPWIPMQDPVTSNYQWACFDLTISKELCSLKISSIEPEFGSTKLTGDVLHKGMDTRDFYADHKLSPFQGTLISIMAKKTNIEDECYCDISDITIKHIC
jgi:hypothetical protein